MLTALHSVREEDDDEEVVTITEEYIPVQPPVTRQQHFSPREVSWLLTLHLFVDILFLKGADYKK